MTKRKQKKMQQSKDKKNEICWNGLREEPTHASYSKGI